MSLLHKEVNYYNKNGFIIIKNILDENLCDNIVKKINTNCICKEVDKDFPFSNLEGNKVFIDNTQHSIFDMINYDKFINIANKLSNKQMVPWFKKIYYKSAWQGDSEVYHQDYEYHKDKSSILNSDNYIQCFIALVDHKIEGGCLNMIKKSHKCRIKHYPIMTRNGLQKLTIPPNVLDELNMDDNFVPLELKKGDCVFFSYLTVHGSASNSSPYNQPRMVIQFMEKNKYHDEEMVKNVNKKRTDNEILLLKKFIKTKNI